MKKLLVRVLALGLMLITCAGFAVAAPSAGKSPKTGKQIVIGITMQGNQSGFIQYITSGMWEWQKQNAPDIKLDVVFADDDAAKQLSQVETFISKKVDAIIINPVDKVQGAAAVDAAAAAKIPILTVNTTTTSTKVTAHVGSDDVQSGYLQMNRIISVCGPKAKVAYIDAVLGHSAQVGRTAGYKKSLAEHPGVQLVVHDTGNWSGDESMKLVENWLQTGKKLDAIACMADCQLIGVVTAIKNANMAGKIVLSGMDCDPVIMDAINQGIVDSSIWQDGVGQGANAVRLALDAVKGKKVSDFFLPYEVCTKDNIDHYFELAKARNALAKKYF
jgi:inositol transport system substrate-binding protein